MHVKFPRPSCYISSELHDKIRRTCDPLVVSDDEVVCMRPVVYEITDPDLKGCVDDDSDAESYVGSHTFY